MRGMLVSSVGKPGEVMATTPGMLEHVYHLIKSCRSTYRYCKVGFVSESPSLQLGGYQWYSLPAQITDTSSVEVFVPSESDERIFLTSLSVKTVISQYPLVLCHISHHSQL